MGEDLTLEQEDQMRKLEYKYKSVFSGKPGNTNLVEHAIDTQPQVVRSGSRNWPRHLRETINKEIEEMLQLGVIEPSSSPWRSYPVVVPKPDGGIRLCIDYCKLNEVSKFDAYPMPKIDDLLERLGGAENLTLSDLTKGYWQVPLRHEDKEKTAFVTPKGLFQFSRMPFGLHGVAATFQRLMDKILSPVKDFAGAYIDDILIYSKNWEEHLEHLEKVLQVLQDAKLKVNPAKCKVARKRVKFLGFQVTQGRIQTVSDKVDQVTAWPTPRTKKELQRFLALAGYYRQFVPDFAHIAVPLSDLTKKKKTKIVCWGEEEATAFEELKQILAELPSRYAPDFSRPFIVQTDTSDRGVGAVLSQEKEGLEFPVMYLSKKLSLREQKYSTIEKEAFAVKWAIQALRYYLLGAPFTLITDHAPLQCLNRMKDVNPRLTRWYLSLQLFNFKVQYRKGSAHANADYFSRQGEMLVDTEERTAHLSRGACERKIKSEPSSLEKTKEESEVLCGRRID